MKGRTVAVGWDGKPLRRHRTFKQRLRAAHRKMLDGLLGAGVKREPDRVVRTDRRGNQTVRLTPTMRQALPGNQPQRRGESTAKRPVRCQRCGGYYGALKSGRPRKHTDVRSRRNCPGGGAR